MLLSIGSTAILARLLIPEHFGLIGMVMALTTIFERFKELGLHTATVQKKDISYEQITNLFWINALFGFLIMLFLFSLSRPVAWFYEDDRLIWITIAIASSFMWSGLMIQHKAILTRKMKFARITAVEIGATFLSLAVAIILALKGYGYWALVWREILRNFFMATGFWIACPWRPGLPVKNSKIGDMIKFGRDISAFNLIYFFSSTFDQVLLGKFWGATIVGLYRQAAQLVLLPLSYMTYPVQSVAEPALSMLQDDDEKYKSYYRKIIQLLSFLSVPLMCFIFISSKDIILLLLGNQWLDAVEIFRILVLAYFVRPLISTTGFVMITRGQTKKYFLVGLFSSILLIIGISIGVSWGAVGVAYGILCSRVIFYYPLLSYSFKDTPISIGLFLKAIFPSFIPSLGMAVVLFYFTNNIWLGNSFFQLSVAFPIGVIIYLLIWIIIPGGLERLKENTSDFLHTFKKTERSDNGA
jgi:O-antigen/teichoic acid export membrane protein